MNIVTFFCLLSNAMVLSNAVFMSNEQKIFFFLNINLFNFYAFISSHKNKNIGTWTLMQVAEDPGTGQLTTDKIYINRFLEVTNSILTLKIKQAPLVAPSGCWKTFRSRYSDHGKKLS